MARRRTRMETGQARRVDPPMPVAAEDKFRSPFTDQREDAPDNWARRATSPVPPVTASTMPPTPPSNWQAAGYHMEDTAADYAAPLDDTNDTGFVTSGPLDWRDDPFQDSAVDPGLQGQRSPEVINHSGPFFEAGNGAQAMGTQPVPAVHTSRAGSRVWLWVSLIVAVVVIVGAVIYSTALKITSITVEGNTTVSAEEIIRLSGIRLGMNVLSLDDEKIGQGIQTNSYLVYNGITRVTPRDVVISVYEREPAAYINYCGIVYIIDSRGNLLAESDDTDHPPALVRLEGIEIRSSMLGERIIPTSTQKLDLYVTIMLELKAMKAQDKVSELYVTNMDNLYLGTKGGYSVHLGSRQDLHAKLRAMILTIEELDARHAGGGTIDVSQPASPNYIPENGSST